MERRKYGDDFDVGDVYTTRGITVTETHMVNWASLTMDFFPLHMDKEYAARSPFGERLVHGPFIFALAVGLVNSEFTGDSALAWLGVERLQMLAPVRLNDTISVTVKVIDKKTTSNPEKGIQIWNYSVKNQAGEEVMVFDNKMMLQMKA